MKRRYRYRAYPTGEQARTLSRIFGCARVVYNDAVALQRQHYVETGSTISGTELQSRCVAQAKRSEARTWLSEVPSAPLEQAVRDADKALRTYFNSVSGRRKGARINPPRFKNKNAKQSARFTRNAFSRLRQTTHGVGHVRVTAVGHLRFTLSRKLPSPPSSLTIIKDAQGHYYVSFVVDVEPQLSEPVHAGRVAAIDLGLTNFAAIVYSDGSRETIPNPRHHSHNLNRLRRAHKSFSRKQPGSNNQAKARRRLATVHASVSATRSDFHNKLVHRLTDENQAVVVERLDVQSIIRASSKDALSSKFRQAVLDAAWRTFRGRLEQNAEANHREVINVDPALTSRRCSACSTVGGKLALGVRIWQCTNCGARLDRDYNAAVNIMVAAGHAETLNARGGNVRLRLAAADSDEARTRRTVDYSLTVAA